MPPGDDLLVFGKVPSGLPRRALRQFSQQLFQVVAGGRPFCCLLTGEAQLRRLNRQFLGSGHATDVLSFPSEGKERLGDIAISVPAAQRQADALGHELEVELQILMLHGLLHLLGMDHEKDRGEMARQERLWRKRLGLPPGLIERVRA